MVIWKIDRPFWSGVLRHHSDGDILCNDVANVAVLAILATNLIRGSNDSSPHRGCGALRNRFPLEGTFTFRGKLLIDLRNQLFNAHATFAMSLIEGNCEQAQQSARRLVDILIIGSRPVR